MRIRARTRSERKRQIYTYLEIETEKERAFSATAVKIAKALDLSPSAHFRAIANEMVDEGEIMSFDVPCSGVVPYRRHYMLIPHKRGKPQAERKVPLKVNGEPVSPLLLPFLPADD